MNGKGQRARGHRLAHSHSPYLPRRAFPPLFPPYRLRACRSQAARLPGPLLWQALSALASFCARVSAFGQPVTAIFVAWRKSAPFWARNSVGIVSLEVHRLAFAASAENLPWGSFSSKELKGTSGVALKVLEVTPFLMNVEPTSSTVTP